MSNSFVTPQTVACQDPLSMGFPRQDYWSELPFPYPGDLLNPAIKSMSSVLAGRFSTTESPGTPKSISRIRLFVTPWTVACQASLSLGFPRQDYWSELPFLSPEDLLKPGIQPRSPALAGRFFTTDQRGKPLNSYLSIYFVC